MNPTQEWTSSIQLAFDHFNEALFNNQLPQVLFSSQRQSGVMGYFASDRWASVNGKKCHEIAINPLYVGRSTLIEFMQTLVHEMVHCWQYCYGKPSIKSYHNRQWANKMIAIGLMPTSTGMLGGAITGQHIMDYPLAKGKFIISCEKLLKEKSFKMHWVDRFANNDGIEDDVEKLELLSEAFEGLDDIIVTQLTTRFDDFFGADVFANRVGNDKKKKVKYSCPSCKINVWGKAGLSISCDECGYQLCS
ncbi:MAG: SprT-like domain-containing protein [Burkholderiales bacterium]|nr:SprT-like domain-containing protein [Burkholderiales bacterium]